MESSFSRGGLLTAWQIHSSCFQFRTKRGKFIPNINELIKTQIYENIRARTYGRGREKSPLREERILKKVYNFCRVRGCECMEMGAFLGMCKFKLVSYMEIHLTFAHGGASHSQHALLHFNSTDFSLIKFSTASKSYQPWCLRISTRWRR